MDPVGQHGVTEDTLHLIRRGKTSLTSTPIFKFRIARRGDHSRHPQQRKFRAETTEPILFGMAKRRPVATVDNKH